MKRQKLETLFSVYRWFGRAMEDGSTKRFFEHLDGQNDFEEERTYELMIMTAKDSFAGTDEDIYIIIHGEKCSSKPILLKQARGSFEQGSKCEFRINHRNFGKIKSIVIGYGPDGEALLTGEGWKLDSLVITDATAETLYQFQVNKWLSRTDGDCKTMMEFKPTKVAKRKPRAHYLVEISTSYLPDNDHKLEPFLEIIGSKDRTSSFLMGNNQFRLDKTAKFKFIGHEVGEIERVRFGIDGIKQLKSEYNNVTVEPCWIVNSISVKCVKIEKGKVLEVYGDYRFSEAGFQNVTLNSPAYWLEASAPDFDWLRVRTSE